MPLHAGRMPKRRKLHERNARLLVSAQYSHASQVYGEIVRLTRLLRGVRSPERNGAEPSANFLESFAWQACRAARLTRCRTAARGGVPVPKLGSAPHRRSLRGSVRTKRHNHDSLHLHPRRGSTHAGCDCRLNSAHSGRSGQIAVAMCAPRRSGSEQSWKSSSRHDSGRSGDEPVARC